MKKILISLFSILTLSLALVSCGSGETQNDMKTFSWKSLSMNYEKGGRISDKNTYDNGAFFVFSLPGDDIGMMTVDFGYSSLIENTTPDEFNRDCKKVLDSTIKQMCRENGLVLSKREKAVINTDSIGNFYAIKTFLASLEGSKVYGQLTMRAKKGYHVTTLMLAETEERLQKLNEVEKTIDFK